MLKNLGRQHVGKKRYEDVRLKVISVTRGVCVKFSEKKCYITLYVLYVNMMCFALPCPTLKKMLIRDLAYYY